MGEKELKQREGNSAVPNQKYFMFLQEEFFSFQENFPLQSHSHATVFFQIKQWSEW